MWKTSEKLRFLSEEKMNMQDFWEAYSIIEKDYFSEENVKKEDLVSGAISWMVDALWDRHSEFMNPEITEKFNEALEWDFEGIWAVVEKVPLWVKIERILKWSPAKKYDVRAWDIVIKANSTELEELDIYDSVEAIKWPAGSQVDLTIIRPGEDEILVISVIRQKIHIPSIDQEYFEDENIAYIAINMFWEQTAIEFTKALDEVTNSWVDGLIIDVRDNGGGYLQSAVQILSEFMPEKNVLVKTRYKDSFFDQSYFSVNDGEVYDKKIVILINENSASASEITAWALREYDKAILIGQKTYGKWSVQQPFDMPDGSLLKLTVAKWFTPEGINIDDEWIMPDIEVEYIDEDYENLYDRQLEEAKKLLKMFIEKETIGLAIEEYQKQATQ
jgi:carboxyl-terminal processing protease